MAGVDGRCEESSKNLVSLLLGTGEGIHEGCRQPWEPRRGWEWHGCYNQCERG